MIPKEATQKLGNMQLLNDDNLGCIIALYYEGHHERPEDDEIDERTGYSCWAMGRAESLLLAIACELGMVGTEGENND